MLQKFFTNTIYSSFIKNLIYTTPIPIYNSVKDGDYIINTFLYVYKSSLIQCTQSGILNDTAEYDIVDEQFYFGYYYNGFTEMYKSNDDYYDSQTHDYLGNYLRFVRDINNLDLMPFYNCFNGVYTSRFYLNEGKVYQTGYNYFEDGNTKVKTVYKFPSQYKTLMIPVKFNKEYTIAIDCNSKVELAIAFINDDNLLEVTMNNTRINLTEEYAKLNINNSANKICGSFSYETTYFKFPFVYSTLNNIQSTPDDTWNDELVPEEVFQQYEKYLYLLIQLPVNNNSSIVVLEGNYKDINTNNIIDISIMDHLSELSDKELNKLLLSGLSLLQFSDKVRHPFANRLMEYLLQNVIDLNDDIGTDIKTVQEKLYLNLS